MNRQIEFKATIASITKPTSHSGVVPRCGIIALLLVCSGLLPMNAFGVVPPPDGGYAGGNTAEGQNALLSLTTGGFNTAVGFLSLRSNTIGSFNTAVGAGTLLVNTADDNTATGAAALLSNTTGSDNTATGVDALVFNTTGTNNTANGTLALFSNTEATENTATGARALFSNNTGFENTAIGASALSGNTTGSFNTANGELALLSNTTGSNNIALGQFAGGNLTTGDSNIDIGNSGVAGDSAKIRIGDDNNQVHNTFIAGIRGVGTGIADAIPVLIDSAGQLGTFQSSRRFKKEIKAMDSASKSILALKPVTFHYKSDKTGTPQFGLIAEEVAEVNPDLVVRDKNGEIYTVRYDAVNAMLLNEFLKEHSQVKRLEGALEAVNARLNEQAAQIKRVSTQLKASKPAPLAVLNNP
jgi:hypothetical protein